MTDEPVEPIEPISPPPPGPAPGSGHAAGMWMTGSAPTGSPFAAPVRSIPPEIRAIPARTPGFAPPQRSAGGEQPAALRPAAGFEPLQQAPAQQVPPGLSWSQQAPPHQAPPLYQDSGGHQVRWLPPAPASDFSRRRNNLVIGASAAAAVAVAVGAIALTHKSAPSASTSADERFSAAFGPGGGDPAQGPVDNGQPLEGSTSAPGGQNAGAAPNGGFGNQAANIGVAAPPNQSPNPAAPKPPPAKPVVSCTGWHTTHLPAQDGGGLAAAASALRAGPYATCGTVGSTFSSGQHMYIWCHAVNGYGATWVYGRIDGASPPGWQAVTALKAGARLGPVC